MSVKIHLMLNSKMLIAGDSDAIVATSLLEASNLVVLRGSSMIHSTANLGLHGPGSLNLSGLGDVIEAQHLVLSLLYAISQGANYLSQIEQSEMESFKELMQPFLDAVVKSELFGHNDSEIKLFLAVCHWQITRIAAPEPVHKKNVLKRAKDAKKKKFTQGPRTHLRANAAATGKEPGNAGTENEKEVTSSYRVPALKPTCSKNCLNRQPMEQLLVP